MSQPSYIVCIGCQGVVLTLSFKTEAQRTTLINSIGPGLKQAHGWVTVTDDIGTICQFNTLHVSSIVVSDHLDDKNQDHA